MKHAEKAESSDFVFAYRLHEITWIAGVDKHVYTGGDTEAVHECLAPADQQLKNDEDEITGYELGGLELFEDEDRDVDDMADAMQPRKTTTIPLVSSSRSWFLALGPFFLSILENSRTSPAIPASIAVAIEVPDKHFRRLLSFFACGKAASNSSPIVLKLSI